MVNGRKADTWALREDKRYAAVLQEGSEVADTRRLTVSWPPAHVAALKRNVAVCCHD